MLAATVLGTSIAFLDGTVVGIAQPALGREFHADIAGLEWVSVGYLLTLSGLLLLGGALGDRFGRRRIFVIGVAWFGVASMLCAIAPSIEALAAARALQGVGGALLTPGSLAIIESSFDARDRAGAIGAWSGLAGVTGALGPFVGGYLISTFSWRFVFLINAPLIIAVIVMTLRHVPETRNPQSVGRIDIAGSILGIVWLVGLSYGLVEGPQLGFAAPAVLAAVIGGVLVFIAFIVTELRVTHPLLPLGIFRSQQFDATNVVTLLMYAVLGAMFFLLPIELQQVSRYSPTAAGASLLPITFVMLVLSRYSGQVASRIGPRLQMSAGPIVVALGMVLFTRVGATGDYLADVLPAVLLFGLGLTITVAPLTATALSSAPDEHAGVASAINNTVARTGSMLAVAILPAVAGITGSSYLHPARFESGFQNASLISAAVCAGAGLLSLAFIRNPRTRQRVVAIAPTGLHGGIDCRAPVTIAVDD